MTVINKLLTFFLTYRRFTVYWMHVGITQRHSVHWACVGITQRHTVHWSRVGITQRHSTVPGISMQPGTPRNSERRYQALLKKSAICDLEAVKSLVWRTILCTTQYGPSLLFILRVNRCGLQLYRLHIVRVTGNFDLPYVSRVLANWNFNVCTLSHIFCSSATMCPISLYLYLCILNILN